MSGWQFLASLFFHVLHPFSADNSWLFFHAQTDLQDKNNDHTHNLRLGVTDFQCLLTNLHPSSVSLVLRPNAKMAFDIYMCRPLCVCLGV